MTTASPQKSFFALRRSALGPALFLLAGIMVLLLNLVKLQEQVNKNKATRAKTPYIFLGYRFLGLNTILKNTSRAGYLTDKDQDNLLNAMEFAQAEYILTPVTLDLNNPDYEYLILAYSSPEKALKKIRESGLVPLRQNLFGIILAKNPKAKTQ